MADLDQDTRVDHRRAADGVTTYAATASSEWAIWGPMGGYIASIALRAAGAHCGRARPASINANFLAVAGDDELTVTVTTLRTTRVATCMRVELTQGDRAVLEATVWGTDTEDGLAHHAARARPAVPGPDGLDTFIELLRRAGEPSPYEFWHRLDYRPTTWIEDWENREPREPEAASWYRFLDHTPTADRWLDDCRLLITTDLDAWGPACYPHTGELDWFAPTIELSCRFLQPASEWLLSWGSAPVAHDGLIGVLSEVWSDDDRLLAIGGSTLLCRPAPDRPG